MFEALGSNVTGHKFSRSSLWVQLHSALASWQDSPCTYSVLLQISWRVCMCVRVCALYGNDGGIMRVCAYVFSVAVACYLWESAGQSNRFQPTYTHTCKHSHMPKHTHTHKCKDKTNLKDNSQCATTFLIYVFVLIKPFVHEHPLSKKKESGLYDVLRMLNRKNNR